MTHLNESKHEIKMVVEQNVLLW